ncbi:hypothetical protein DN41_1540 [Vibrio cholerae]|nr:hypothetical protein DN41_1540 [Vibrio cholerae]GHZ61386.1 hypothetical protein VCSRO80_2607 [Vibrio cholerae]
MNNTRDAYYEVRRAVRRKSAVEICNLAQEHGFELFDIVGESLLTQPIKYSLDLRLVRFKRVGRLVPMRYRP